MSYQASRELRRKTKKELRREAIAKSRMREGELREENPTEFLIPDPEYDLSRNVLDCVPGRLM